jgi:lipopolysaccharide export LptBFGC system permease protein LptF
MRNVSIWWVDEDTWRMERRLDAPEATFQGEDAKGKSLWRFPGGVDQAFEGDGRMTEWEQRAEPFTMAFGPSLERFLQERRKPEEMNSSELGAFLEILGARGQTDPRYETDFHLKFAFPLGVILLSLISFACALRAQYGTFVQGVGQGLFLTTTYFLLTAVLQAIGHAGVGVPGVVCAWLSNVVFLGIALWMLFRVGVAR